MVWCGVTRCGVVWCGVGWRGVVCFGVVWYDVVWRGGDVEHTGSACGYSSRGQVVDLPGLGLGLHSCGLV